MKALELELSACDADYQQALSHVKILQARDAADTNNNKNKAELDFLRSQSVKILQENRNMRRTHMRSSDASGGGVVLAASPSPDPVR